MTSDEGCELLIGSELLATDDFSSKLEFYVK